MSHIVGDIRPSGFKNGSFVLLGIAAIVVFVDLVSGDDIVKAMAEIGKEKSASGSAAAASKAEAARPKDYTELSLGGELMRCYKFELKGTNKRSGWLILDERATSFRFDTSPDVETSFVRYPNGERIAIPAGTHNPNLWQFVVKRGREDGGKQFFLIEAKGDCVLTVTVSR